MSFWETARILARDMGRALERGLDPHSAKKVVLDWFAAQSGIDDRTDQLRVSFMLGFVERWLESGLPRVLVGERLAASLCSTSVPADFAKVAHLPFYCFGLSVPPGIFGAPVDVFILDAKNAGRVRYLMNAPPGFSLAEELDLGGYADVKFVSTHGSVTVEEASAAERKARLVGRLIVGVALEMSSLPIGPPPPSGGGTKKRDGSLPRMWDFRVSRPVAFDARPYVRDYLRGDRRSLSLQRIVRGHWQRYHTREGLVWKHKEPYFQGDADAPIAAPSVVLGG